MLHLWRPEPEADRQDTGDIQPSAERSAWQDSLLHDGRDMGVEVGPGSLERHGKEHQGGILADYGCQHLRRRPAAAPVPESSRRASGACPEAHGRRGGGHYSGHQLAGGKRQGQGAGNHRQGRLRT